jgi:hypothetical protein
MQAASVGGLIVERQRQCCVVAWMNKIEPKSGLVPFGRKSAKGASTGVWVVA